MTVGQIIKVLEHADYSTKVCVRDDEVFMEIDGITIQYDAEGKSSEVHIVT